MKKCVFFVLMACLLASPSFANDLGRSFGMGGAFIAVADDPTAIFYNPAGLSQLKVAEVGGSGRTDASILSNKFKEFFGVPSFSTDGTNNATNADFSGITYPFLSSANPLVLGFARGNSSLIDVSGTGKFPSGFLGYADAKTSWADRTQSLAVAAGYEVLPSFSLGLSVIRSFNTKYLDLFLIDTTLVNASFSFLKFDGTADRYSVLLGGLYKLSDAAAIGATVNVPSEANRVVYSSLPVSPPLGGQYVEYSYPDRIPIVAGIGFSYKPVPLLLFALDVKSSAAMSYDAKPKFDWGYGSKMRVNFDSYAEIHAGCEYTFDLGGGAGVPVRVGWASVPSHLTAEPFDVVSGFGSFLVFTEHSTRIDSNLLSISCGYKKEDFSIDLGLQSVNVNTTIKADSTGGSTVVKNSTNILSVLLSVGASF